MTALATPETEFVPQDDNTAKLLGEVDTLRKAAVDAVTDTRRLQLEATGLENTPSIYDRVRLVADTPKGRLPLRILEGAHEQIAYKADIPWKYYERMLHDAPDLLATNVNRWHTQESGKRMVRMLRPTPDQATNYRELGTQLAVRAILSDKYKALDHGSLLNTVLPVALANGVQVSEWKLTDKHFFLRMNAADQTMAQLLPGFIEQIGWQVKQGIDVNAILAEVLGFGAALRNSETGHGALMLEPQFRVRRCMNVVIVDYHTQKLRAVHIGRKQEEDEQFFQADTRALDNAALFLKVRDRLVGMFSGDTKQEAAKVLLKGMGTGIELPEEIGQFEFIEGVSQTFDLGEDEQKILKEEILAELQFTGQPLTPFAISQGLTATARRLGEGGDFGRKNDLEHAGWQVLEDPVEKLIKAATKAVRKN